MPMWKGIALFMALLLPIQSMIAEAPQWWTSRGVLNQNASVQPNDYAPINQGQLKNLARAAAEEIAARLATNGGTGAHLPGQNKSAIDLLVEFPASAQTNDYAPVTLGQLKAVAKPFYDRLIEVNIVTAYPWQVYASQPNARPVDDYALANIGQAKKLFAFVIPEEVIQEDDIDTYWDRVLNGYRSPRPSIRQTSNTLPPSASAASRLPAGSPVNLSMAASSSETSSQPNIVIEMYRESEYTYSYSYYDYVRHDEWEERSIISFESLDESWDEYTTSGYWDHYYYYVWDPETETEIELIDYSGDWIPGETVPAGWEKIKSHGSARVRVTNNISTLEDMDFIFEVKKFDIQSGAVTSTELLTITLDAGSTEKELPTIYTFPHENELVIIEYKPIEPKPQPPPAQDFTLTGSDSAGPAYKKIGLNGIPIPDSKPQIKDETGENPEETYIDAYTRELKHSSSDVYVSIESSLLPLMARRDVVSDAWNPRSGLRPNEKPDRPFGVGWTSNICSNIRIDKEHRAYITDELGSGSYYIWDPGKKKWTHSREQRADQKTLYDELIMGTVAAGIPATFTLRKKYGTTCHFERTTLIQSYFPDRVKNIGEIQYNYYYRLKYVTDRWGNRLDYTYPSSFTLIPSYISDPKRPGHSMSITQHDGVITSIRGPNGSTTHYNYSTIGTNQSKVLASVKREDQSVIYGYNVVNEVDLQPEPDGPPEKWEHIALNSITDGKGNTYRFGVKLNRGFTYLKISDDGSTVRKQQLGLPMHVEKILLPNGSVVNITGQKKIPIDRVLNDSRSIVVTTNVNSQSGEYTYTFSNASVYIPVKKDPGSQDLRSRHISIGFQKMLLNGPAGSEEFHFSANYGMALTYTKDISGNVTQYGYAPPVGQTIGFDDPISQTDALGGVKYFTYHPGTRVLQSVTDERGIVTSYNVQNGTGLRLSETISGAGATNITNFTYGKNGFVGFLATKTVSAKGDMPSTVVHYTPDAHGRVKEERIQLSTGDLTTTYYYDLNGNKTGIKDSNGNVTTFDYDRTGHLRRTTYPDGSRKSLAYDARGNLYLEQEPNGTRTIHSYDALNRRVNSSTTIAHGPTINRSFKYNARNQLVRETDPRGKVTTYSYDSAGRRTGINDGGLISSYAYGNNSGGSLFDVSGFKPTLIKEPSGRVTNITYDKIYRPTKQEITDGGTTHTQYDAVGNVVLVIDPLNRHTVTQYDNLNQPVKVTYPDNTEVNSFYTHGGQVWKTVDSLNRITLTKYDAAGRAIQVTNAENETVYSTYDKNGNVTEVKDALNRITKTAYDSRNRPVQVTAPAVNGVSAITSMKYDVMGNVIESWDPLGYSTRTEYDGANRVIKAIDSLGGTATSTYDANGNVLAVTNALGQITTNTYDAFNRLTKSIDALGIHNDFTYDAAGNRLTVSDGKGNITQFTYDKMNRVLTETYAGGDVTTYAYNSVRKLSKTDSKGITSYGYDLRDRVTDMTFPGGTRNYVYDAAGQLKSVTEPGSPEATVAYTYDNVGRVKTEVSRGQTHTYHFDDAGNRTEAEYSTGRTVTTTYDALNRPSTITENGRVTTYGYDLAGRAISLEQANGLVTENLYDALGRLKQRKLYNTNNQQTETLALFNWNHDALGNVKYQGESWPGDANRTAGWRRTKMEYDAGNRLFTEEVTEAGPEGNPPPSRLTTYLYDAAHNRTSKTEVGGAQPDKTTTYVYNEDNQLTSWTEVKDNQTRTATLTYDDNGNRSSQTVSSGGNTEATTYTWDSFNRLTGVTLPSSDAYQYRYDYRTRRITTGQTGGDHTAIVFAGGLSVAEYDIANLTAAVSSPTSPAVQYQRGPNMGGGVGGLLYSLKDGGPKFNLSNGRGDVVAQSDTTGELSWTASYEAGGKRTLETGQNTDKQRANTKDEDPTGLLNEGFRYRDLETGVWLSRDPAGFVDGPNLYAYVLQNPWTAFDPEGLYQQVPAALLHANGIDTTSHAYQTGFNQGAAHAARVATPIAVGIVATVYTGGAATPLVAKLGLGSTGTMLTTTAISGAAGGTASQMTSNAMTGQSLLQNVPRSAATGAALNMIGGVLGQTVQGFNLGLREGTAIATAKELAKGTAAGGAPAGTANVIISGEGQIFTGLSKNAGGGPVSPAVSGLYGSARTTCAEARALTAMEQAGVNPQGAVSAAASVGVKGLPAGTPMPACEKACAPVLRNAGIGDAVAGTSPALAPVRPTVPVKPTTEDEKK